jgi:hypothetical protein
VVLRTHDCQKPQFEGGVTPVTVCTVYTSQEGHK